MILSYSQLNVFLVHLWMQSMAQYIPIPRKIWKHLSIFSMLLNILICIQFMKMEIFINVFSRAETKFGGDESFLLLFSSGIVDCSMINLFEHTNYKPQIIKQCSMSIWSMPTDLWTRSPQPQVSTVKGRGSSVQCPSSSVHSSNNSILFSNIVYVQYSVLVWLDSMHFLTSYETPEVKINIQMGFDQ